MKRISYYFMTVFTFSILFMSYCSKEEDPPTPEPGPNPINNNIKVETLPISDNTYKGDDGLSVDSKGSIYVSHLASNVGRTVFKVEENGSSIPFLANLSAAPMGHVFDVNDQLFVAFNKSGIIAQVDTQGVLSEYVSDARFSGGSLAIDEEGTLYHSVFSTNKVYKISTDKQIEEIASGGPLNVPFGLALDENKNVYVANFSDGIVSKITPDGNLSQLADVPGKVGYLIYGNGKLYATGFTTHIIYTVDLDGTVTPLIGSGTAGSNDGVGAAVTFASPNGIGIAPDGKTLYVSQKNFSVRKITLE